MHQLMLYLIERVRVIVIYIIDYLSQGRKVTAVANDKNWNFSVRESIWQETTVKESSPCPSSLGRASQRKNAHI